MMIYVSTNRSEHPSIPDLKQGCLIGVIFTELCPFCPSPAIVLGEGYPSFARVSFPLGPVTRIGQTIVKADDPPERNGSSVPFGNDWIRINQFFPMSLERESQCPEKPLNFRLYEKPTGKQRSSFLMMPTAKCMRLPPWSPRNGGEFSTHSPCDC